MSRLLFLLVTLVVIAVLVIASHNLAIGFLNLIRGIPTDQGSWSLWPF